MVTLNIIYDSYLSKQDLENVLLVELVGVVNRAVAISVFAVEVEVDFIHQELDDLNLSFADSLRIMIIRVQCGLDCDCLSLCTRGGS